MKHNHKALVAGVAMLIGLAGFAAAEKGAKAMKKDVVMTADAVAWKDGPAKGTKMAALWGDMDKDGPYGVLIKFDAGITHPLHWHTSNLKIVVISGTFVHKPEGGQETRLGPGSYLMQAGGLKHVSGCAADAPCEFLMTSGGKFDMNIVGSSKGK